MIGSFGWQELLIIAVIILLLFGGRKFGDLMKSVGDSVREFKKASHEAHSAKEEVKKTMKEG